jgi:hypothetical protein
MPAQHPIRHVGRTRDLQEMTAGVRGSGVLHRKHSWLSRLSERHCGREPRREQARPRRDSAAKGIIAFFDQSYLVKACLVAKEFTIPALPNGENGYALLYSFVPALPVSWQ